MTAVWTVWCGHSACHCSRHDKWLKYHLTVNHKTQSFASHRHSVFEHFKKDQIMFIHSVLPNVGWNICQYIEQQKTLLADKNRFTTWRLVSFVGKYQTRLHKPQVTIKGAVQSVCRPSMNSAETVYNNTMYAISTERLKTYKAFK